MVSLIVAAILQRPVALPAHAMRLDALLREMTVATGENYRVAAAMGGRIVLVAGAPRPAEPLRADLARAVWGIWRHPEGEWVLEEDRAAVQARAQARLDKRIEVIGKAQREMQAKIPNEYGAAQAKSLAERMAKLDSARDVDPNRAATHWEAAKDVMPSMIALRRIISRLGTKQLAAQEGPVVYSDRPTRLQQPLSSAAVAAIRGLEHDQTVWAENHPDDPGWREGRDVRSMDPRNYGEPAPKGSYRLVLRTEEDASGSSIQFTAWFVDARKRLRQFAEFYLPLDGTWRVPGDAPKVDLTESPMALSMESVEHARALTRGATGPLRTLALAPDQRDPLDFTVSEACRSYAATLKLSVVAWLPDRLLDFESQLGEKPQIVGPRPSEWARELWVRSVDTISTGGSVVLRPRAIPVNVDRKAVATLVQATDRAGFTSLDGMADYAAARDDQWIDDLGRASLDLVLPGASRQIQTDWRSFKLWGIFTRKQREALLGQGIVRWDQLAPAQRSRLTHEILFAQPNEIRMTETLRGGTLEGEPTELLANGLASDGTVVGTGSIGEGMMFSPDGAMKPGRTVRPEELAEAVTRRARNHGLNPNDGLPDMLPAPGLLVRTIRFGFTISLAPNVFWSKSGRHSEYDLRGKPLPMNAMPIGFRTAYQRALESLGGRP